MNYSESPSGVPSHNFVRYIGINLRSSSFAFILIEGGTVLDSGIRKCELPQFHSCLTQQFDRVLLTYTPSIAIISSSAGVNPKKRTVRRKLKAAAANRGIEVAEAGPAVIRRYFSRFNAGTRYEIAQVVAEIFPELAWKLPPKRKAWQHEAARMSVFDAAAAVVARLIVEEPVTRC
jgi:hypothetical protein